MNVNKTAPSVDIAEKNASLVDFVRRGDYVSGLLGRSFYCGENVYRRVDLMVLALGCLLVIGGFICLLIAVLNRETSFDVYLENVGIVMVISGIAILCGGVVLGSICSQRPLPINCAELGSLSVKDLPVRCLEYWRVK